MRLFTLLSMGSLMAPAAADGGGGKKAKVAEPQILGAPVAGKPGWFHPGPDDNGIADSATHLPTGDEKPYVKVGGLWLKTTAADIDAKGLRGLAHS